MMEMENAVRVGGADEAQHSRVLKAAWAWVGLGSVWVSMTLADWPFLWDGVLISRLTVFGGVMLILAAAFILPRFWRLDGVHPSWRTQVLRMLCGVVAFALFTLSSALAVNARDLMRIALGADEFAGGLVHQIDAALIEVQGPLSAGIAARLRERLNHQPGADTLLLNSEGGWVVEGERIGRLVSEFGLNTHTDFECSSACTAAFVYGRRRTLSEGALLGFHSSSGEGTDPMYIQWTNEWLAERLVELGVSTTFIDRAFSTPPGEMWYPTHQRLMREGIVHDVSQ